MARIVCPVCGKEFIRKHNKQKYCSRKCRDIATKQSRRRKADQLCWKCKNSTGGCSWSRRLIPVKGWKAIKIERNRAGKIVDVGYNVLWCPLFNSDGR